MRELKLKEVVSDGSTVNFLNWVRKGQKQTRLGRWNCLVTKFTIFNVVYYLNDKNGSLLIYCNVCLSKMESISSPEHIWGGEGREWLMTVAVGGAWLIRGVCGGKESVESVSTATKPLLHTDNGTGNRTGRWEKEEVASIAFAVMGKNATITSKPVHNCYKHYN